MRGSFIKMFYTCISNKKRPFQIIMKTRQTEKTNTDKLDAQNVNKKKHAQKQKPYKHINVLFRTNESYTMAQTRMTYTQ